MELLILKNFWKTDLKHSPHFERIEKVDTWVQKNVSVCQPFCFYFSIFWHHLDWFSLKTIQGSNERFPDKFILSNNCSCHRKKNKKAAWPTFYIIGGSLVFLNNRCCHARATIGYFRQQPICCDQDGKLILKYSSHFQTCRPLCNRCWKLWAGSSQIIWLTKTTPDQNSGITFMPLFWFQLLQAVACDGHKYKNIFDSPYSGTQTNHLPLIGDWNMNKMQSNVSPRHTPLNIEKTSYLHI